jgi:hypothetical protein
VLVLAVGLPWIGGGLDINALDVPTASLFTDGAAGGMPIGVIFLVLAAVGIAVALIRPVARLLGNTLWIVGAISTLLVVWYLFRVLSLSSGARLADVLSIGVWITILASIGALLSGITLAVSSRRAS